MAMTPGQARVALWGFVLLAIGVTTNALYLQGAATGVDRAAASPPRTEAVPPPPAAKSSRPAKAEERASGESPQEPVRTAQTVQVRRVATVALARPESAMPPREEADADTVREVQAELNRHRYGPLPADGRITPAVRDAIMAFEQDRRLPLTGEASQELLKSLLFGTPDEKGAAGGGIEVRSPQAQALVRQVQQLLAARGFHPGAADGRLSPETIAAVRAFEADQGLVPKGHVSFVVLERLQAGIGGGGRHPGR